MSLKNRPNMSVEQLTEMQRYLGEETVEDYQEGHITRRRMIGRLIAICGTGGAAALMTACGVAQAPPTVVPTAVPTAVPATAVPTAAAVATKPAAPAATQPPAATPAGGRGPLTVAANDPDVDGKMVTYKSDTEMIAYLARPKKEGTYPAVLVIHENRGLQEHIKDVARRLAKAGFIALAPDLVSRSGGSEKLGFDPIAGVLGAAKPEDLVKDLSAGVDYLLTIAGVKAGKVGVVGFCFGGGYTLRLAGANPKVAAAVPYYGPVPTPPTLVASTNAAILAHYGGTDTRVNAGIPDLEAAMKAAGKTYEKRLWEGAPHAFNNDTGTNFNEAAAVGAWKETLAWFTKYL